MRFHPVRWCVLFGAVLGLLGACEGGSDGAPGNDAVGEADTGVVADVGPGADTGVGEADVPVAPIPTVAEMLARGPHSAGVRLLALEDPSRTVMANGTADAKPTRPLPTQVWYPTAADPEAPDAGLRDAPVAAADGPFPLVIYAHGFMTRPLDNAGLGGWLASRGYVVAGPEFPLTNLFTPGGANAADVVNQPADVRFVLDSLLAANEDPQSPFFGAIDPERIALVGLSLGAMTAALSAFHDDFRDDRVDVVAALALPGCFLPADFFADRTLPLLLVNGTMDAIIDYEENATRAWAIARAPRVEVAIVGGTHTGFADAPAPVMDNLDNPDTVGCNAIGGNETVRVENLAPLLLEYGGEPKPDVVARCHTPCDGVTEFPPSMKATVQSELMFLSVGAFLDAWIQGDAAARRFLTEGLAAQRPGDVVVQVDLGE